MTICLYYLYCLVRLFSMYLFGGFTHRIAKSVFDIDSILLYVLLYGIILAFVCISLACKNRGR